MYNKYVYPDRLISPLNGHVAKRLTSQNITKFGFESIADLHVQFPDFPLRCSPVVSGSEKLLSLNANKREQLKNEYNKHPKHCTYCNGVINFELKQSIFCSKSCAAQANNYSRSISSRNKQKETLNKTLKTKSSVYIRLSLKLKRIVSYVHKNPICQCCGGYIPYSIRSRTTCSENCRLIIHRTNSRIAGAKAANTRALRSKDEIALFNLCSSYFSYVEHNTIIADGWDADIVIPTMKLAIMWNGPWHYMQMPHKNHSLAQVQNRDYIKTKLFGSLGWEVIVFEDRYFTPKQAFIYLLSYLSL